MVTHSPIDVWFRYSSERRRVIVRKVKYGGRPVRVKEIGAPVEVRRRGILKKIYRCRTEGGACLTLAMDKQAYTWTCEEARNFMGDLIE